MKAILTIVAIFLAFVVKNAHSQNGFAYEKVPEQIKNRNAVSDAERAKTVAGVSGLYDLTKSLPQNFVKDGSVDYTDVLQAGINANQSVIFPDFPVLVNSKGIILKSNTNVIFAKNSKLILSPTSADSYQIIRMYNVSNTRLYYPNIIGDRNGHTGTTGEAGMGISIRAGSDDEVFNPSISNCWGDGIYLADGAKNITLYKPYVDNNRRNGISIVSANGVKVYNLLASNTNGTAPAAGIDIEPNNNADIIDNILLQDPITYNNKIRGVLLVLKSLAGITRKNVNIDIINHRDVNSGVGMGFYLGSKKQGVSQVQGNIRVKNPDWRGSKQSPIFMDTDMDNNMVNLQIINPKAEKRSFSDLKKIAPTAKNVEFKQQ